MSGCWHLRDVLSIDPDSQPNCVGEAYKGKKHQGRCGVKISGPDLSTASWRLDQMDRSRRIAPEDLEELAALLLCKLFHNSQSKPHLNQIGEVSGLWNRKVAAVKTERETAKRLEAEKLLAEKGESMKMVKDDSKLEEQEKACHFEIHKARPVLVKNSVFSRVIVDDPFKTPSSSSGRPNIFTQSSPLNDAQKTEIHLSDFPTVPNNAQSEEGKNVVLPFSMRSPSTHEPSPTKTARIAVTEQQETGTTNGLLDNHEESVTSKFAFAFGSKSGNLVPAFQFETPTKAKINQAEIPPFPVTTSVAAFDGFSFGASTCPMSLMSAKQKPSEELRSVSLQEEVTKPVNMSLSGRDVPSSYEFGSRGKTLSRPFEFEAPLQFQPPSNMNDSTERPAVLFKVKPHGDDESDISSGISDQPFEQLDVSNPRSAVSKNNPQLISNKINRISAQLTTPPNKNEDTFGYANITPNSTRYTTYLPARQKYGLNTPPETPEMLIRSLDKPMGGPGYFKDTSPRDTGSPVPKLLRKPLPSSLPAMVDDVGEELEEVCSGYVNSAGQGTGDCHSGEVEVEARTGCLTRLGIRKMKEKTNDLLTAILRRKENVLCTSSRGGSSKNHSS